MLRKGIGAKHKIMEIKNNESTDLRPEGARLMDAPLVSMDIPEFIKLIKTEATWQNSDRNAMTVYKTNGMRIVLIALHENAVLKKTYCRRYYKCAGS